MHILPQYNFFSFTWKCTISQIQSSWQALSMAQCNPPFTSRQCWPNKIGEYLSYFQIFPGKGAHDIIRQSFPVSQNPRHSWYQTFPAAPEVNFSLVSKCFVRPWTRHTLRSSCYTILQHESWGHPVIDWWAGSETLWDFLPHLLLSSVMVHAVRLWFLSRARSKDPRPLAGEGAHPPLPSFGH